MTALTTFKDEFLANLRGFVRKRVASEHDAEDIVQDVLTRFVEHHDREGVQSVQAWLFTVAQRAIIDRSRSASERRRREFDESLAIDLGDEMTAAAELARCLEPMLASLEYSDRELLRRVDMNGESQADIAREIGLSMSGLKSRVQRSRQRLRATLEACCTIERDRFGQPADYHRNPTIPACPCDCGSKQDRKN